MRTSETFHPSHGIHVNPKYLEARHQFKNLVTDNRHSREVFSEMQVSGHKSFPKYNDHDLDHLGFQPPNLRMVREGSPQALTLHGSSMLGQAGPFLNSQRKVATPASPTRIGLKRSTSPLGQRFQRSSPGRLIEAASLSQSGHEFQSHRASQSNGWFGRSLAVDDGVQQSAAPTMYNRYGRQRQRELIDAYGNYRSEDFLRSRESFPKIQCVDVNGIKGKAGKMDWQNFEEEEYVWEDMSPTLADQGKRGNILFEQSTENFGLRANSSRPGIISEKSDFRRRSLLVPPLKDSTTTTDERIAIRDYGHESMNKMHPDDIGSIIEHFEHHESSQHAHEHDSLPHVFHHSILNNASAKSQGRPFQLPYLVGVTPLILHKRHGLSDNSHNAEVPFLKLSSTTSDSLNVEMPTLEKAHQSLAPVTCPLAHNSQALQLLPTSNLHVDNSMPIGNQQSNFSVPVPYPQFDANGRQLLKHTIQETHGGFIPPVLTQPPSGVQPHGQSRVLDSILSNPNSGISISSVQNMFDVSLHGRTGMPPLPPGPPPLLSQPLHTSQNGCSATSQSLVSGFSGLISSLMAQGLISLTHPAQTQNTVGLAFNVELLKIRHESAINAMYAELPRQCTTCGLRFACQDDHSNHMDWHVTKNRISKNRKQKPSRKWFVSAKEWLCGVETLGVDAVPGFLPTEAIPEKKEEIEMVVPADENQISCALCGEPFEDFYSDETEEWMYRGAIYLNAPNGDIEGLERSQLGPIAHVKCMSESIEGFGQV